MDFSGVFRKGSQSTWCPIECGDGGMNGKEGACKVLSGGGGCIVIPVVEAI